MPHVEKKDSFLLGFIAALAFAALVLLLLKWWNHTVFSGQTGKNKENGHSRRTTITGFVLAGILVSGSFAIGSAVYRQAAAYYFIVKRPFITASSLPENRSTSSSCGW